MLSSMKIHPRLGLLTQEFKSPSRLTFLYLTVRANQFRRVTSGQMNFLMQIPQRGAVHLSIPGLSGKHKE